MKIGIENVNYIYSQEHAQFKTKRKISVLNDISLDLEQNTINLFLGPSGAGKTTLFNILSLNLFPATGQIKYNNEIVLELNENLKQKYKWDKIGYLHQNLSKNYITELSLIENLKILKLNDKSIKIEEKEIKEDLKSLGLTESHLTLPISVLSGGEKQRISLLLIKYRRPSLYILDEPTSFLDALNKKLVINFILKLKKENNTILIASHDFDFINICNELFLLLNGSFHKENVLNIISELMYAPLIFKSISSRINDRLTIPNLIYKYIEKNSFFNIIIDENNHETKLTFKKIDNEDVLKKNMSNWVFINHQELTLPEGLLNVVRENDYYWKVDSQYIYIILSNNIEKRFVHG